ncbi:MAG: LacI family DNA-binding transcriptional regulator [Roseibium sp.]|uniref:LacI family DNA-binding transcriptional regulator n=1 Tax=Roseibium sp. TaxID=1936156 RepID=UPI0026029CCB|nr:LacI family DNA-binding transcriptional regulator [Roseibium sp.]MCV0425057.1 LacI family DNA-binding transcriptional regulator [Roseibium sp.]
MTNPDQLKRRARIAEIARLAGVGTATVDRVLNDRPNVSPATRQRVEQAKAAIETGEPIKSRSRPWRLKVFLPGEAGPSTEYLAACFQEFGARGNATIECVFTKKMEPAVLARKLQACAGQGIDAIAFQALDDPRVRHAVEELAHLDIPCLTLISGLETPALAGFVGMDNRAAGKTAGYLMGRFERQKGAVAVVSGGQIYRVHEDREMGFRACLRRDFPHLEVVSTYSGHDDIDGNYTEVRKILESKPDLIGIYNVGGGNEGIAKALREAGRQHEITFFGHNLTPKTQGYLLDGTMDLVLHQNMKRAAGRAVDALIARLENRSYQIRLIPTEIITRENMMGATFG